MAAVAPATHAADPTGQAVVRLVNQERAERGLTVLAIAAPVVRAARGHSVDMGRRDYFSHATLGSGARVQQRVMRQRPGPVRWLGETIGWGSGSMGTARGIVDSWMDSPVHRRTLLDRRFRAIGVGTWRGAFQGYPGVTVFTVNLAG